MIRQHGQKKDAPMRPPPLQAGNGMRWEPLWAMTDDFWSGKLQDKWVRNADGITGRAPSFYKEENVTVTEHSMILQAREDQPRVGGKVWQRNLDIQRSNKQSRSIKPLSLHQDYSSAYVRSASKTLYGYFEICANLRDSEISSAFWLSNNEKQDTHPKLPSWWTEINVFLYSTGNGNERMLNTNLHVHRFGDDASKQPISRPESFDRGVKLSDEAHKFALDWNERYITWLIDDIAVRKVKNLYHHRPLYLKFDSQTFPKLFGLPATRSHSKNGSLGDFEIFYVRCWKR